MEQGQCWIQPKRKYSMSSNLAYGDSWEEQAFAEDAAGSLGGCIWPPRSYSCSFCRREFRSAQALGGHMNVHRKDRARLKQPSSPPQNNNNEIQGSFTNTSFGYNNNNPYPSLCGLVYQTNPNSDPDFLASPSASKALLASREETLIPFYNSSENSWPNFHPEVGIEKVSKGRCRGNKGSNDDSDVAMSLNLFVCKTHQQAVQFESNKETDFNCKKRKTDASFDPFLSKSSSFHDLEVQVQPQIIEFNPSYSEELDLELRLGTRSKV